MLNVRNRHSRSGSRQRLRRAPARPGRPGAREAHSMQTGHMPAANGSQAAYAQYNGNTHALADRQENSQLYAYESNVKEAFDAIVPTLKQILELQQGADYAQSAQQLAREHLGYELPADLLGMTAEQLDMRGLFAWCVFETYHRFCDEVFMRDPLGTNSDFEFQSFLQDCGFHLLDVSPCADGRMAHVIRYVLRLPYKSVRRRSYAGAMFDIEDSLEKWVKTELVRFREGRPNNADEPTRYLKAVVYHHSSVDPDHEGCAAHGSDTRKAAEGGRDRLVGFQQAVQNTHCCGASIDYLLLGLDTDTDAIRIHMPDVAGDIDLNNYIDSQEVYDATVRMSASGAEQWIKDHVEQKSAGRLEPGMARFITHLLVNNMSQIEYVHAYYGGHYSDIGHAERFIGAGIGFEEVQLRNLTFFAYMNTVEEAAKDLDVGVHIFSGLNVSHGLPIPIVVRFDYHGNVPGARERAEERCQRVADAFHSRYDELSDRGMLHTLQVVRDINASGQIEILDCSIKTQAAGAH